MDAEQQDYICVGVCLPDEDEAYCIGCGRPWGMPNVPSPAPPAHLPPPADDEPPKPA